jgi:HK97 family phage prohead protease
MKRVVITTEAVNSYGTRVLTAGIDLGQYEKNPVLLYMHRRGEVIGVMKDLRIEGDRLTGEPDFDEASELSRRCKAQWEKGSLKMVSVGIDILATSDAAEDVVVGQTTATITRSRLFEVSVVDIGANDEAMVLTRAGKIITLGQGGENPLPGLTEASNSKLNNQKTAMELKEVAQMVGLPETADEQAVKSRLETMKQAEAEKEALLQEKEKMEAQRVTELVDGAIAAGKILATSRERFVQLGGIMGSQHLAEALESIVTQRPSLTAQLSHEPAEAAQTSAYKSLHDVPAEELMTLRKEQPKEYARLYKAEYGVELPQD